MRKALVNFGYGLLSACGALWVLIPTSPLNMPLTNRDSGAFLYAGWRILNGAVPYRDVWDHKPPVIFFINALGLALADNSRWGVWILEFISLLLASLICIAILKKLLGPLPALAALFLWLFTLVFLIQGGNYTTEYALPMQFLALWLVLDIDKPGFSPWRWFFLGLIGAIAFFTKQTSVGIWIAIIVYWIYQRMASPSKTQVVKELLLLAAGSSVVFAGIGIYFGSQGALSHFWSAAFAYNFSYVSGAGDFISRLKPIFTGIGSLTKPGLLQFGMIGALTVLILIFAGKKNGPKIHPLLLIGLLDLPIEFILLSASGRTYEHYYMVLLPALALFSGWLFQFFLSAFSDREKGGVSKYILAAGTVLVFLWASLGGYHYQFIGYRNATYAPLISYIAAHTGPDDYVLVWGNESMINFYAERQSPTRFVYLYPLYQSGYTNERLVEEFLKGVLLNHPKLIVNLKDSGSPFLEFPLSSDSIQAALEDIRSAYVILEETPDWVIYGIAP
ncbi:MAG: glycosyltransferase family 39 protein [Anaerolineales bacterium]